MAPAELHSKLSCLALRQQLNILIIIDVSTLGLVLHPTQVGLLVFKLQVLDSSLTGASTLHPRCSNQLVGAPTNPLSEPKMWMHGLDLNPNWLD